MNKNWSLKELYESFEADDFKRDMESLDGFVTRYNEMSGYLTKSYENTTEKLEEYIKRKIEVYKLFTRLGAFIHLTLSTNSRNEEALKYSDRLDVKESLMAEADAKLESWIGNIPNIEHSISKSEVLKEHAFILREVALMSKYLLSEKEEAVIAKLQNTGSNGWQKLKDVLISNLMVEMETKEGPKELPLSVVRNLAYEGDAEVRKRAYEAELASYKKIEDGMAASLNGIKGEAITLSEMRGYKSPLHQTLVTSRMDEEALEAMLTAMKESLPIFRRYMRTKGELLGHKNGLPFYELFAPVGELTMEFSYERSAEFIIKNFRTFSDNLGDFAKTAIEKSWIDVYPKEGKQGGAFCSNLHVIGESRFLLNHGDTFSDAVTMAHELGHGFHGHCLKDESPLNSGYPMPLAETASTFCETIVKKAAIKDVSPEDAFIILESEISDSNQIIVDIYSRFLFEREVFNRRKEGTLSSKELKEIMLWAQKEAYGDGLDPEYMHPYMWACKTHYYYPSRHFYNFPYAFGLLFAKGLYAEYLKRGESFPKDYEELLSITGKSNIADVTKVMGIDIHDVDFWRGSLAIIKEDIEKFLKLSEEKLSKKAEDLK